MWRVVAVGILASASAVAACASGEEVAEQEAVIVPSPLDVFFGDSDGREAAFASWQLVVQDSIAKCMALEGFDFVPSVQAPSLIYRESTELSEEEWTSRYGYGVSTSIEHLVASHAANPNNRLLATLDESERTEYLKALYGDVVGGGSYVAGEPLPPLEAQGCAGESTLLHGGEALGEDLVEFSSEWDTEYARLLATPEVVSATTLWSSCMSAEGYRLGDPSAARQVISSELEAVLAPLEGTELLGSPQDLEALFSGDTPPGIEGVPPDFSAGELAALQDRERQLASSDLRCYDEHVAEVLSPLIARMEERLIEQYRPTLESIRDLGS